VYNVALALGYVTLAACILIVNSPFVLPPYMEWILELLGVYVVLTFLISPVYVVIAGYKYFKSDSDCMSPVTVLATVAYMLIAVFIVLDLWPALEAV